MGMRIATLQHIEQHYARIWIARADIGTMKIRCAVRHELQSKPALILHMSTMSTTCTGERIWIPRVDCSRRYNGACADPSLLDSSTAATPLAPSVEKAYYRKCIQLKRRLNEVEAANDEAKVRRVRLDRSIMKMRLERAFLLEQLSKRMENNADDSEGSAEEGMVTVSRPRVFEMHCIRTSSDRMIATTPRPSPPRQAPSAWHAVRRPRVQPTHSPNPARIPLRTPTASSTPASTV